MNNLRATVGKGAMITWTNKGGERIVLPLINTGKEWRQVGVFLKYGQSKSDPKFAAVFPLPHGWTPSSKILRAIRKAVG